MLKLHFEVFNLIVLLEAIYSQVIDISCNYEVTNTPGVCQLLSDCQIVRDNIIKTQSLPQICGFQKTQPIVCCPREEKGREPGEISKRKCKEYASYAYAPGESECGHKIVKRIIGGEIAGRKEFAHMALVGLGEKPKLVWACGGTIISEQFILTAAHCLRGPSLGLANSVKVGITNLNDTTTPQEIKIIEHIPHPDYIPPSVYNDIALLKLEKPIKLSQFARPACLNTKQQITVEKAIAIGFGYTAFAGEASNELLKVTLNLVDFEFCNMTYGKYSGRRLDKGILDEKQFCAGSSGTNQKDTCQGDAGGPLQIYHDGDDITCMYDIIGIISYGKGCGISPGVYTRVSHYVKWIEDTVWPQS